MPSCGATSRRIASSTGPAATWALKSSAPTSPRCVAAFTSLRLVREQIIADGRFLAARNTFSGGFTGVFTASPIGAVEPTGQHTEWEVINTFRYDEDGRLAEEWVHTGYRSFLAKLGVTATERRRP